MAGQLNVTPNLHDFQEAATKYRPQLLYMPIIGCEQTLKHMTPRPGIRTETDIINHAYAALGRHHYKVLCGKEEETDMSKLCEVIRFSEERLRKAQARYDYIKAFGLPKKAMDAAEMIRSVYDGEDFSEENELTGDEDDNDDITIAVADEGNEENDN